MAMPSKLKNFLCHRGERNAREYIGKISEVTLPKLARKLEEYRGGGMDGAIQVDLGQEPLELEIKCGGLVIDLIRDYARPGLGAVPLRFTGAYERDDTCQVDSVEVYCRGKLSEFDPGDVKLGEDTEHAFKYTLVYYRLRLNNRTEIEIDLENMKLIVGGVDRLMDIRNAIGLR